MKHLFTPEGKADLYDAAEFYEAQRAGLGIEFAVDVGVAIAQVLDAPMRWAQIEPGIRKYRLGRFPFAIYYKVDPPASVVIFAVVDLRSHPDAWRRRRR